MTKKTEHNVETSARKKLLYSTAESLYDKYHVSYANGQLWYWDNNHWEPDYDASYSQASKLLDISINTLNSDFSIKEHKEIYEIIQAYARKNRAITIEKSLNVHFNNGIKGYLSEFSPNQMGEINFFPNIINDIWEENPQVVGVVDKYFDFLSDGKEDIKNYLLAVGWLAHSTWTLPQITVLLGTGANGKSSYTNFLRKCVGDHNTGTFKFSKLGGDFGWSNFLNKTLMISSEMEKKQINADEFKQAVGDDMCSINMKFRNPINIELTGTIIQLANQEPILKDSSNGVSRRLVLIEFKNQIYMNNEINPKALTQNEYKQLYSIGAIRYARKLMYESFCKIYNSNLNLLAEPHCSINDKESFALENDEVYSWLESTKYLEKGIEQNEGEFRIYPELIFDAYRDYYKRNNDGSDKGLNYKANGLWKEVKNLIKSKYNNIIAYKEKQFRVNLDPESKIKETNKRGWLLTLITKPQTTAEKIKQLHVDIKKLGYEINQKQIKLNNMNKEVLELQRILALENEMKAIEKIDKKEEKQKDNKEKGEKA